MIIISINNNPIYNGNDGAVGDYCGGGGGIISSGNNNKGGDGKILNWFDETLIFGAGGNGANYNENRKLGYGCGGNGGDCCYFSKSLINNNGNNGCILIYVNDNNDNNANIEHFSLPRKYNDYLLDNNNSIASKLIDESFKITNTISNSVELTEITDRKTYFQNSLSFTELAVQTTSGTGSDYNDMHNFIYDVLVISKIYAVSYRLLYYYYAITCSNNITDFTNKTKNIKIKFTNGLTSSHNSTIIIDPYDTTGTIITLNNIFEISNLALNATKTQNDYKAANNIYVSGSSGSTTESGSPNILNSVFEPSVVDGHYQIPLYHNTDGTKIDGFDNFITNSTNINKIGTTYTPTSGSNLYTYSNTSTDSIKIDFYDSANYLTHDTLQNLITSYNSNIAANAENIKQYKYTRILLYIEAFNNIINTSRIDLVNSIKYQMYKYNAIIYNVILQYDIFQVQNKRLKYTTSIVSGTDGEVNPLVEIFKKDIKTLSDNLKNIINININTSSQNTNTKKDITKMISTIDDTDKIFLEKQLELNETINKYNGEYQNYNNFLYYYKIIIIIAIFFILAIFFIFTLNNIDINTKIGIYIFMIILIIILLIFYNNYFTVSESFVLAYNKDLADITVFKKENGDYTLSYASYISSLNKYNTQITTISTNTITDKTLYPISTFTHKVNNERKNKAEFYKLKNINLQNALEILKKSSNTYYYMIILMIFSIIILLFSLIILLLNPNMLLQVFGIAAVFLIILIYYVSYNINKSTRIAENKNYWANFNPSKNTLESL